MLEGGVGGGGVVRVLRALLVRDLHRAFSRQAVVRQLRFLLIISLRSPGSVPVSKRTLVCSSVSEINISYVDVLRRREAG